MCIWDLCVRYVKEVIGSIVLFFDGIISIGIERLYIKFLCLEVMNILVFFWKNCVCKNNELKVEFLC